MEPRHPSQAAMTDPTMCPVLLGHQQWPPDRGPPVRRGCRHCRCGWAPRRPRSTAGGRRQHHRAGRVGWRWSSSQATGRVVPDPGYPGPATVERGRSVPRAASRTRILRATRHSVAPLRPARPGHPAEPLPHLRAAAGGGPRPPGAPGFWVLSRFDDVFAAALDTATFSSAQGLTFEEDEILSSG